MHSGWDRHISAATVRANEPRMTGLAHHLTVAVAPADRHQKECFDTIPVSCSMHSRYALSAGGQSSKLPRPTRFGFFASFDTPALQYVQSFFPAKP